MRALKSIVIATCLAVGSFTAGAATVNIDDSVRTKRDIKRDLTSKPREIIAFSGIKQGMVVADILGGGGYYTEMLSQVVGSKGKVYLHNNQAYMKFVAKELAKRMEGGRLPNVIDYKREVEDLDLPANSLDAAFFVLGYHDMYHKSDDWSIEPHKLIAQIKRALKPGAVLLVIDHAAPDGTETKHSQKLHRIDEAYVTKELSSLGFELIKEGKMLRNPNDSRKISPFRPEIRRKTDRFVHLYRNKS